MNNLSPETLAKLEQDARMSLNHTGKHQRYILIKPEDALTMITEIKKLRKLADPQALTAAYMIGKAEGKRTEDAS